MNDAPEGRDAHVARTDFAKKRDEAVAKTKIVKEAKEPSDDLVAYKDKLRPLMATVMGAFQTGHPDLVRHLHNLSDLIQN